MSIPQIITEQWIDANPNYIFVFGDNLIRKGRGGAARLRYHKQTYGFITKKAPNNNNESFYTPEEYSAIFKIELIKLWHHIHKLPDHTFLISRLGAGLANRYGIFEVDDKSTHG